MSMTRGPLTVLGEPVGEEYDVVLAHEHIFLDLRSSLVKPADGFDAAIDGVTKANAGRIRSTNPFGYVDNLVLDDDDLMCREMEVLSGRRVLIVDVTPDTLGRSADRLADLSRRTGVDIVTGCGAYVETSWPRKMNELSQDQLTEWIVMQFQSERRPSVIGEIGVGPDLTEPERRSLRAAAAAHRELGVPLYVHVSPWHPLGHEALDLVQREIADLERVVVCHLDVSVASGVGYAQSLLERDCYIALDIWGNSATHGSRMMPSDEVRAAAATTLTTAGFGERIVHSQDICTKTQLSFGGPGYGHMDTHGRALLRDAGLDEAQIDQHLVQNTLRLLRGPSYRAKDPLPRG